MSSLVSPLQHVSYQRSSTPSLLHYANDNRFHPRFNDLTILCDSTTIKVNSMVLSCYCSYFEQILTNQTNDQQQKSFIEVQDIDGESLKLLIQYIYTGQIYLDNDNVLDILSAADCLKLDEVKNFCFEFLSECLTPDNCITVLTTAKQYRNFGLRDKAYQHMSDNYEAMTQTLGFETLDNHEIFLIVYHLRTRFTINDEVLCRSLLSWTKHDEENRTSYLHRMIKFVNVDKLSFWFIKEVLAECLIRDNVDILGKLSLRLAMLKTKETKMLSIGGYYTQSKIKVVYSLDDDVTKVYSDLPFSIYGHESLVLNKFVYCFGGFTSDNFTNKVFRLNFEKDNMKWKEVNRMRTNRCYFGAAVFNDSLVVCGGYVGNKILSLAEVYNSVQNKWNKIASLNQPRYGNKSATSGGSLYTMGGVKNLKQLSSMERLNGLDRSWTFVSSMQTERSGFAVVCCNDVLYAIGGVNDEAVLKNVEKYDCAADKWTYVADMNIERFHHSACVIQGKIFVSGGWKAAYQAVYEIDCYDPSIDRWKIVATVDDKFVNHSVVVV